MRYFSLAKHHVDCKIGVVSLIDGQLQHNEKNELITFIHMLQLSMGPGRFFVFSLSIVASNVTSLLQKLELSGYQVDNSSLIKRLILIVCMLKLSTGGDFYFFGVEF